MIYTYLISLQGSSHIKNNVVCQDAGKIIKNGDNMVVAAVADGLGSEKYSDTASKIASEVSAGYCAENIKDSESDDEILNIIRTSFSSAQRAIEREAAAKEHDLDQYDTTLTLAVLIDGMLFYGHSGDSGIIALTSEGLYVKVTEQQRDEYSNVFPLVFEDSWIFGKFAEKVCSVLLATDGMLETFFPFLIKKQPVDIHINLARFFMDNRSLRIDTAGENAVQERIKEFVENIPGEQVNDDKTIAVLVNTAVESKLQPEDYYREPDWAELKRRHDEEWNRLAYPHMFKDKPEEV